VQTIEKAWESAQKKEGLSWLDLLSPLSLIYQFLIKLRHIFYSWRLRKKHFFSIPIVCVGNIRVGGSGKTPFVLKLVGDLLGALNICVISTGYKSLGSCKTKVLAGKDSKGNFIPALFLGDEPAMIQKRFPQIDVFVCKNRKKSVEQAIAQHKDLVIFDDGFQCLSIVKDIHIVMLDPTCQLTKMHMLPRGPLRDDPKRLSAADYIVLNYSSKAVLDLASAAAEIQKFTQAPIIATRKQPTAIQGEIQGPVEILKNKKIALFCAIAQSSRFIEDVKCLEPFIVKTWTLSDHAVFSLEDLSSFSKSAKQQGAELLVCTEKDYVKVHSIPTCLPKAFLEVNLEVIAGQEHYKHLLRLITSKVKKHHSFT
jgi:tetraacyldisaccharide 4'-kinase